MSIEEVKILVAELRRKKTMVQKFIESQGTIMHPSTKSMLESDIKLFANYAEAAEGITAKEIRVNPDMVDAFLRMQETAVSQTLYDRLIKPVETAL